MVESDNHPSKQDFSLASLFGKQHADSLITKYIDHLKLNDLYHHAYNPNGSKRRYVLNTSIAGDNDTNANDN